jgi:nitrogen regulatory protein PII
MKMVMVVYDAGYDDVVREALDGSGTTGVTIWRRVLGTGQRSDPKMDDSVWPGYNNTLMTAVPDDACFEALFEALAALRARLGGKGVKVFAWPLEKVL